MPHKKCADIDCLLTASFGYFGKGTKYCSKHKEADMINLLCKLCHCGRARPCYNIEGLSANFCVECKTDDMINVNDKKCFCGRVKPCFNFDGLKAGYCAKCKTVGMINVKDNKCKCGTIPNFNYKGLKPEYCSKCKLDDMVDVAHKKCCICEQVQACFNYEGLSAEYCAKCKKENMIDVKTQYNCFCGKSRAHFNYADQKPKYCSDCKLDDMINITNKCKNKGCYSCGSFKYNYYCTPCFSHLFPNDNLTLQIRIKTKEIIVRDYINSCFDGFQHDIPLWTGNCDCSHRRRIDHRKMIGNTLLCIETDEFQHHRYNKSDEENRYDDLYMAHGGKLLFIRFNPDKYRNKNNQIRNPKLESRLSKLQEEISKQICRIENEENTELLEIIYLFYNEC